MMIFHFSFPTFCGVVILLLNFSYIFLSFFFFLFLPQPTLKGVIYTCIFRLLVFFAPFLLFLLRYILTISLCFHHSRFFFCLLLLVDWIIDCDRAEAQLDDLDRDYGRCSLVEIGTMVRNWVDCRRGVLQGSVNCKGHL
uniref:(northern house mosquito) hypothetical protein n=1 Tax=Culex pipiens TaxID=7175 RepID=A0A8D8HMR6_CULPI